MTGFIAVDMLSEISKALEYENDWTQLKDGVLECRLRDQYDGDHALLALLAAVLATLVPFVEGKDGDQVGFMMGDTSNGFNVNITSAEFLACCRSMWIGADVLRGFGRYLNFRWNTVREAWVEAGSGLAFIGADSQVAYMLETATSKGDSIRFDPMEGKEETVQLFRLLLETAKCADIPVRFAGGSGGLRQGD